RQGSTFGRHLPCTQRLARPTGPRAPTGLRLPGGLGVACRQASLSLSESRPGNAITERDPPWAAVGRLSTRRPPGGEEEEPAGEIIGRGTLYRASQGPSQEFLQEFLPFLWSRRLP